MSELPERVRAVEVRVGELKESFLHFRDDQNKHNNRIYKKCDDIVKAVTKLETAVKNSNNNSGLSTRQRIGLYTATITGLVAIICTMITVIPQII